MKGIILSGAAVLFLTAGCANNPPNVNQSVSPYQTGAETRSMRDHYFGVTPLTEKLGTPNNPDAGDYYDGNKTPPYHGNSVKNFNIGHDQDMMRYTVNHTADFKPGAIAVIGDHAWVNVKYTGQAANYERDVANLKSKLASQMPRYTIHVRVTNR